MVVTSHDRKGGNTPPFFVARVYKKSVDESDRSGRKGILFHSYDFRR
jgi:hypothetical protein